MRNAECGMRNVNARVEPRGCASTPAHQFRIPHSAFRISVHSVFRIPHLDLVSRGPLAQRLEQRTHNPSVPGSNPGGPTAKARYTTPRRHDATTPRGTAKGRRVALRGTWRPATCNQQFGWLAQLVRAPVSHTGGHRFESCTAHLPTSIAFDWPRKTPAPVGWT